MKGRQFLSIVMSAVMAASICAPFAQTSVYAAEEEVNEAADPAEEAPEEEEPSEEETSGVEDTASTDQDDGQTWDDALTGAEKAEAEEETGDEVQTSQTEKEEESPVLKVRPAAGETEEYTPGEADGKTSEDLFADYVNRSFGIGSTSGGKKLLRSKRSIGSGLSGIDGAIYKIIAEKLPDIAAGNTSEESLSTEFTITVEDLGLEQTAWTAEELGVESIYVLDENGDLYVDEYYYIHETDEAVAAAAEKVSYDLSKIIDALLADHPYELYWYDKKSSASSTTFGLTSYGYDSPDHSDWKIGLPEGDSITIKMPVAGEFAAGPCAVRASVGQSVQTAVSKARSIVSDNSKKTDFEKIKAYKEAICQEVAYNDQAAEAENMPYGNPWQLIWVFDDDPSTDVVCEGYAKAFKYLCDLTDFDSDISCILVAGNMAGGTGEGPHMWNVVTMDDGENYLVDVTNCDDGTIGAPDLLFLKGYSSVSSDGMTYTFLCGDTDVNYTYDEDTTGLYGAKELMLAAEDYFELVPVYADVCSLTLDGTIGVNFKMILDREYVTRDSAEAVFVYKGKEYPVKVKGMEPDKDQRYVFTFRIPAKELANTIGLKFKDGDRTLPMIYYSYTDPAPVPDNLLEYSAQTYCQSLDNGSTAKPLIRALQNYCAAAYLGLEDTEDVQPVFASQGDLSAVTADMLEAYKASSTGSVSGLDLSIYSLVLKSATKVYLKFELEEGSSIEDYRFELEGSQVEAEQKGKYWVVTIPDISAKDLDTMYTLTVKKGSETQTVKCSALSYCYTVLSGDLLTKEMQDTVKALYLYNREANAYFPETD